MEKEKDKKNNKKIKCFQINNVKSHILPVLTNTEQAHFKKSSRASFASHNSTTDDMQKCGHYLLFPNPFHFSFLLCQSLIYILPVLTKTEQTHFTKSIVLQYLPQIIK